MSQSLSTDHAYPAYPAFSEIVRSFAPGWFASVMGTGALALAKENAARAAENADNYEYFVETLPR